MNLDTKFGTIWLIPGNFQSSGSISTNDTLAGRGDHVLQQNGVALRFDPVPICSSKVLKGNEKGFL